MRKYLNYKKLATELSPTTKIEFYFGTVYLGYSYMEIDGTYNFVIETSKGGCWPGYILREIADKLKELNAPYEKELDNCFRKMKTEEQLNSKPGEWLTCDKNLIRDFTKGVKYEIQAVNRDSLTLLDNFGSKHHVTADGWLQYFSASDKLKNIKQKQMATKTKKVFKGTPKERKAWREKQRTYISTHRDEWNEYQREEKKRRYAEDPAYRERLKEYQRARYAAKKKLAIKASKKR